MGLSEILLILAIIPSIFYLWFIYKKDKKEKEPSKLLAKIFVYGVLSASLVFSVTPLIEGIVLKFIEEDSLIYTLINAFFIVALVEETSKYLMLKESCWNSKDFNYTFDAIVYGAFCSLGFATIENILYVFTYGFATAIVRAISAVPAHMIFGVLMGSYYGRAKLLEKYNDIKGKKINIAMAITSATVLHGLYDYCLMTEIAIAKIIFFVIMIFLYVYMFVGINKLSREDEKIPMEENVKSEMQIT